MTWGTTDYGSQTMDSVVLQAGDFKSGMNVGADHPVTSICDLTWRH